MARQMARRMREIEQYQRYESSGTVVKKLCKPKSEFLIVKKNKVIELSNL